MYHIYNYYTKLNGWMDGWMDEWMEQTNKK